LTWLPLWKRKKTIGFNKSASALLRIAIMLYEDVNIFKI
jgi:hypothetical protein